MVHLFDNNRYLDYYTPLSNFLKNNFNYSTENLLFSTKYTSGTFTITNPTSEFKNCDIINGYPHFRIPLDICFAEIEFFMNDQSMYNNNFIIRYGDTHPHKPIPKLGQTRNLIIADYLSKIIGKTAKEVFPIGDISIKSLRDFVYVNNIDINPDILYSMIVNNTVNDSLKNKLYLYDKNAIEGIEEFLNQCKFLNPIFLLESSLYSNQDFYKYLKTSSKFFKYLKDNGEIKYTLQELMFIKTLLKNSKDVLINIIGSDQKDHIVKVNNILRQEHLNVNSRFLSYEICKNSLENNIDVWANKLELFIEKNSINISNKLITYQELLKILFLINSNDVVIDFENLNKHLNNIKRFCNIYSMSINSDNNSNSFNLEENTLLFKMSLVNYTLNRTVELGDTNHFYKYILDIISEYQKNSVKYKCIEGLYYKFIKKCFDRLGLTNNYIFEKGSNEHVLSKTI